MSNYKKTAFIVLSVLSIQLVTTISNANAQESLLATLDTDLDGLISLKEAAGHAKLLENFNVIDVNEDGYISLEELATSEISQG